MDNTEFALVVMTDPKNDMTQHIFLLDMVTENYKLISTLEHTTQKEAKERAAALASLSLQEIKNEVYKIADTVLKEDKEKE